MKLIDAGLVLIVIATLCFAFLCDLYEERILALELERDQYLVNMIETQDIMSEVWREATEVTEDLKRCERKKR
ncbi:MAG: hypothetical protein EOM05_09805 [Clostridia bacterium]|nr:hypothetical protein [Clostridia bacterium]